MKALATRALSHSDALSHVFAGTPPQSPLRQGQHTVFELVDERSALVDSPSFREQLRNANDWSLDARARVERVAKLLQNVGALEAELSAAKNAAVVALGDITRWIAGAAGLSPSTRTLANDASLLADCLCEAESSRSSSVCFSSLFFCVSCVFFILAALTHTRTDTHTHSRTDW